FGNLVGGGAALAFAVALLASGASSSSVGTYAGQVVMAGFINVNISVYVRRIVTMIPALVVLAIGVSPTKALVLSQVVLSFGIPFALIPLVMLTSRRDVMGVHVNKRLTTSIAWVLAALITALNVFLLAQTFGVAGVRPPGRPPPAGQLAPHASRSAPRCAARTTRPRRARAPPARGRGAPPEGWPRRRAPRPGGRRSARARREVAARRSRGGRRSSRGRAQRLGRCGAARVDARPRRAVRRRTRRSRRSSADAGSCMRRVRDARARRPAAGRVAAGARR